MNVAHEEGPSLAPVLERIRRPVVFGLVAVATVQHVVLLHAPADVRLSSMLAVYGGVIPALGWVALRWLVRLAQRVDRAQQGRLQAAAALRQRNNQIEALYSASRLLAEARRVAPLLDALADLTLRLCGAEGVGIQWQPNGTRPAQFAVAGDFTVAQLGEFAAGEQPAQPLRRVRLQCDRQTLGWIVLKASQADATTHHSLELLVQEITVAWQTRRNEHRAVAALTRLGDQVNGVLEREGGAKPFLAAMAKAIGASGAAFYRRQDGAWRYQLGVGRSVDAPEAADALDEVWRNDADRVIYACTETNSVLALAFDNLPSRYPSARDRQLLLVIAAQTAWLVQVTEVWTRMLWHERSRIAAELHDGLSQTLAYLHLQIGHARATLAEGRADVATDILSDLTFEALEAYQSVRLAVDDLRMQPDLGETVAAFLLRMTRAAAERYGLSLEVDLGEEASALTIKTARILANVFQEALVNAARHGRAQRVVITWRSGRGRRTLQIADDGGGFDTSAPRLAAHHGLKMMHERLLALGGDLGIESRPGEGATVIVELPPGEAAVGEPIGG